MIQSTLFQGQTDFPAYSTANPNIGSDVARAFGDIGESITQAGERLDAYNDKIKAQEDKATILDVENEYNQLEQDFNGWTLENQDNVHGWLNERKNRVKEFREGLKDRGFSLELTNRIGERLSYLDKSDALRWQGKTQMIRANNVKRTFTNSIDKALQDGQYERALQLTDEYSSTGLVHQSTVDRMRMDAEKQIQHQEYMDMINHDPVAAMQTIEASDSINPANKAQYQKKAASVSLSNLNKELEGVADDIRLGVKTFDSVGEKIANARFISQSSKDKMIKNISKQIPVTRRELSSLNSEIIQLEKDAHRMTDEDYEIRRLDIRSRVLETAGRPNHDYIKSKIDSTAESREQAVQRFELKKRKPFGDKKHEERLDEMRSYFDDNKWQLNQEFNLKDKYGKKFVQKFPTEQASIYFEDVMDRWLQENPNATPAEKADQQASELRRIKRHYDLHKTIPTLKFK